MTKTHRIGGTEISVTRQTIAGGEVYALEIRSKSSLDYSCVVINLSPKEFQQLVDFMEECGSRETKGPDTNPQ